LPGRIYLAADPPALTYKEWNVDCGRPPENEGESTFIVHLAAWDSGRLRLECKRCREPLTCPHGETALHEILETCAIPRRRWLRPWLCAARARLVALARPPGYWLGKTAKAADDGQRLVWEVAHKGGRLAVFPVLQRLGKRGAWGRGQRLRLDELETDRNSCATLATAARSRA